MARLKKVSLVGNGRKIVLTDKSLHWYRTGDKRSRTHIHQFPDPGDPKQTHSWTFCGLHIETGMLNIEREVAQEVICKMCLGHLQREYLDAYKEIGT